jgi:Na+-driven multidrug efflux pump
MLMQAPVPLIAAAAAAGNDAAVKRTVTQALSVAVVVGTAATVTLQCCATPLLSLMGAPASSALFDPVSAGSRPHSTQHAYHLLCVTPRPTPPPSTFSSSSGGCTQADAYLRTRALAAPAVLIIAVGAWPHHPPALSQLRQPTELVAAHQSPLALLYRWAALPSAMTFTLAREIL